MLYPTQTESLEVISQTIVLADFTLNVIVLDVLKQGKFQFVFVAHISGSPTFLRFQLNEQTFKKLYVLFLVMTENIRFS